MEDYFVACDKLDNNKEENLLPFLSENNTQLFKSKGGLEEVKDNPNFEIKAVFIKEESLSPCSPEMKNGDALDDYPSELDEDLNEEHPPLDPSEFLELSLVKSEKMFVDDLPTASLEIKKNNILLATNSKEEFPMIKGPLYGSSRHKTTSSEKQLKCEFCGEIFSNYSSLRNHKRIHTGEKLPKCDICGKIFSHYITLRTHMNIHTGEKPHKCNICGKAFSDSSTLRTHYKIHTGEKPHHCSICGKSFALSKNLKRHNMIHTKEKPFKCDICGKAFSRSSHLIRHKGTHSSHIPHL